MEGNTESIRKFEFVSKYARNSRISAAGLNLCSCCDLDIDVINVSP